MTDCQHPTHYLVQLSGRLEGARTAEVFEKSHLDYSHLSTETLLRQCALCGDVLDEDERFEQLLSRPPLG